MLRSGSLVTRLLTVVGVAVWLYFRITEKRTGKKALRHLPPSIIALCPYLSTRHRPGTTRPGLPLNWASIEKQPRNEASSQHR